ncbi:peptidase M2 family protein [Mangrovimicrobium sediminis]|uniref:Peptidase M2 family protein n=1 Tax=Mangrovimicrobium sediminis TaxID=2562682 RepID=A0A4Z0LWZ5_9GAMM|nr:M2 family metallopeptidase [Haliea sp. SAOS-164]TGD71809.1 peptidase M2 family protein [Haliea sp. SAOS-164]
MKFPHALIPPLFLLVACSPGEETGQSAAQAVTAAPAGAGPGEAREFIAGVERDLEEFETYSNHVSWVRANFITYDTDWLYTRVDAEETRLAVDNAQQARQFESGALPEDLHRKLNFLKLKVNLPAPAREGAAAELAEVNTRMVSRFATSRVDVDGEQLAINDLEERVRVEQDPAVLAQLWSDWRAQTRPMREDYVQMVELANAGARELGYDDAGAMWRSRYELAPDAFAAETDRLWSQVKPLYEQLHCHVRARLNEVYGDEVVPLDQPIRADLLGNMWAQEWGNIYSRVAPADQPLAVDLDKALVEKGYTPLKMMQAGEAFFSSLGFEPLPQTFWERSLFTQPRDRDVVCHASAWNLDGRDDIRIKMCTRVTSDDFTTVHHELGHNYYQRAYKDQDFLFRGGANGGFHEAIGDLVALSITPEYLQRIGLIDTVPDASADLGLLLRQALDKIAFLPFGLLMDKWRWQVFSGEVSPQEYNDAWWALREQYQGLRPPVARDAADFDPGSKYHIGGNVSYTRYFIARILQFQFHRAACEAAGWQGPLHRCSIYGSEAAGAKLRAMLEQGRARPWPELLEGFTGSREMDGSAIIEYFAPLSAWLEEQNAGRQCGW